MYIFYDNLLNNLPAFVGLFFAGVWLVYNAVLIAYGLNIFKVILKFINQRKILIPSLVFIASPFISTFVYELFTKSSDNLLKAFTPITCITAYIAYQQYQINRQQLRKNLSDKPLQIYMSAMNLVYATQKDKPEIVKEKLDKFEPYRYEAHFLLNEEINIKFEEICSYAYELISVKSIIEEVNNYATEQSKKMPDWYESQDKEKSAKDLLKYMHKSKEIRDWFLNIIQSQTIQSLFKPYINLSNIAFEPDKN
ncbi:hypothetical protein JYQ62_35460 [Nostoc sp. UHCC 0702]|nr:hypothetical protein JYQ62_35460 [Nostoc sp. UHCC 0702]